RIEVDPTDGDTLLNGVVDPQRFEDRDALRTRFGLRFSLELYDDDGVSSCPLPGSRSSSDLLFRDLGWTAARGG
ncbi:hypothetical protein, partial [Streptomyces mexicanus]|uniref:hypothetical protein n=1 Tax=Streptomyces mexicanus TaxID=178566 RepID=UPI00365E8A4E